MAKASQIELPGGRRLCYAEFGDPEGRPLLYFHGFPGSRLEARLVDTEAAERGLRIVAVDRPGFGGSDFQSGRTLLDWPGDVAALAAALGLPRFSVLGASGGGPYALACARRLADRLDAVAVASGLGPVEDRRSLDGMIWFNRRGLLAVRRLPPIASFGFALARPLILRDTSRAVAHLAARTRGPDRDFFASPHHVAVFAETLREAFRQGSRGLAREARIYCRPWGFRPEEIRARVLLWHGELDEIVPVAMGRRISAALPDCEAAFYPEEGHFSLAAGRVAEILSAVAERAAPRTAAPGPPRR